MTTMTTMTTEDLAGLLYDTGVLIRQTRESRPFDLFGRDRIEQAAVDRVPPQTENATIFAPERARSHRRDVVDAVVYVPGLFSRDEFVAAFVSFLHDAGVRRSGYTAGNWAAVVGQIVADERDRREQAVFALQAARLRSLVDRGLLRACEEDEDGNGLVLTFPDGTAVRVGVSFSRGARGRIDDESIGIEYSVTPPPETKTA